MSSNNLELWRKYTEHFFSPDDWITLGWLYSVNAALQRRVYIGKSFNSNDNPLFPNLYLGLIGPPACGKGLVISATNTLMKHHQLIPKTAADKIRSIEAGEPIYLFAQGPDKITFEELCREMSQGTKSVAYKSDEGKDRLYIHSSMSTAVEEMKVLFGRGLDDKLPTLLLQTYDCKDFVYATKNRGRDFIKNPCLSIIGAAIPKFIVDAEKYDVFNDGFMSRFILSFELKPRKDSFFLREFSEEQLEARKHLLEWILKLSHIFGRLNISPETTAFIEDWWEKSRDARDNVPAKMQTYIGRKRVNLIKLAMAFHFSDSLDLTLVIEDFQKAIDFMTRLEVGMRWGFKLTEYSYSIGVRKDVLRYMSQRAAISFAEIYSEFNESVSMDELNEMLIEFQALGKIVKEKDKFKVV